MLYAAYGSNMNHQQMMHRCPGATLIGTGYAKDYCLMFAWKGVATIQPAPGTMVPVVIWDITAECEKSLDRYEGFPRLYGKAYINVGISGESEDPLEMMAYILNPPYSEFLNRPMQSYFNTIKEGYIENHFDISILEEAMRIGGRK